MKFIDPSTSSKHPGAMQEPETLTHIAETTVEHVATEVHKKLTIAMEAAIVAVTASVMNDVSSQMKTLVQDAVGYASANPSISATKSLHLYGGAHVHTSGGGNGHGYGRHGFTVYFNGHHHDKNRVLRVDQHYAEIEKGCPGYLQPLN